MQNDLIQLVDLRRFIALAIVLLAAAPALAQTPPVVGITKAEIETVLRYKGGDRRPIAAGDVVIVPAGVPHGFDDITDHLTYLSIRPDLAGVLPANYVHPALRK
jgi:hypothetical protein